MDDETKQRLVAALLRRRQEHLQQQTSQTETQQQKGKERAEEEEGEPENPTSATLSASQVDLMLGDRLRYLLDKLVPILVENFFGGDAELFKTLSQHVRELELEQCAFFFLLMGKLPGFPRYTGRDDMTPERVEEVLCFFDQQDMILDQMAKHFGLPGGMPDMADKEPELIWTVYRYFLAMVHACETCMEPLEAQPPTSRLPFRIFQ